MNEDDAAKMKHLAQAIAQLRGAIIAMKHASDPVLWQTIDRCVDSAGEHLDAYAGGMHVELLSDAYKHTRERVEL